MPAARTDRGARECSSPLAAFWAWISCCVNAGALDHVSFEPTAGTLSVATYPAATTGVGGNTAAVYLSAFTVSKMLMSGPEGTQAPSQRCRGPVDSELLVRRWKRSPGTVRRPAAG